MEDTAKHIAEGLRQSIQGENDAHYFYTMAAGNTTDPKGRETFNTLAEEELKHRKFLEAQYKSVIESGAVDMSIKLGIPASFDMDNPVFTPDLRKRIAEADFEMAALSVGMQLELNAIRHYQAMADETGDAQLKGFFTELVAWETGHYEALSRQEELLKEDFWSSAGFAPF